MNRYVSVPSKMMDEKNIPAEAANLARIFSLEIRQSENSEIIEIFSEPQTQRSDYEKFFTVGHVWSLDITDEFEEFDSSIVLINNNQIIKPKLKELHVVKFRHRFDTGGIQNLSVYLRKNKYFECQIEEKK